MVKLLELENGVRRNKKNKLREYKSIGVDITFPVIWIFTLFVIGHERGYYDIIKENLNYALFSIVVVLIFSVNVIKVNSICLSTLNYNKKR